MKKYFQLPKNVDDRIPTSVECSKIIRENTEMDSPSARTLGERVNDYLRYKLVNLRAQKALHNFAGKSKPSKDEIAQFVRNREWGDVARIVDKTSALWKPAKVSETKRCTRSTSLEEPADVPCMFFCKSTSKIHNLSKVMGYVSDQRWPFLQVSVNFKFTKVQ